MASIAVTILQNGRCDKYGIPLLAGTSYSLDFNDAGALWQAGFAYVADPTVFDRDNSAPSTIGMVKYAPFSGFRRCLLTSLVVSSTASRSSGVVTVTATAHGVTTGATYQGYRFFYPGSPSLAAGWYDSIISVATNTIQFYAPGPDFASESVNGAAAYTTQTTVPGSVTIPPYAIAESSRLRVSAPCAGGTTAATKSWRTFVNGLSLSAVTATTTPFGTREADLTPSGQNTIGMTQVGGSLNGALYVAHDRSVETVITNALTISAAADFAAIIAHPGVFIFGS